MTELISALLLPPLNLIVVCAVGFSLQHKCPCVGRSMSIGALVLLTVLSTPAGALLLVQPLEQRSAPSLAASGPNPQAIVILGGAGADTLYRTRHAAELQRKTGLPILITGASKSMIDNLQDGYKVPIKWIEQQATNTEENAEFSATVLRSAGLRRIFLVTDGVHMARAQIMFSDQDLDVIPSSAQLNSEGALQLSDFLPSGEGLRRSHYAMHEWLGIVWYWLRHLS